MSLMRSVRSHPGGTLVDGLVYLAVVAVAVIPVRALLAWVYNRTGSLVVVGLTHAAGNAAALALAPLFAGPVDGFLPLVVLGLVVIAVTRGRLGLSDAPRRGAFAELHRADQGPVEAVPVGERVRNR